MLPASYIVEKSRFEAAFFMFIGVNEFKCLFI